MSRTPRVRTDWLDQSAPAEPGNGEFFLFTKKRKKEKWRWREHKLELVYLTVFILACAGLAAARQPYVFFLVAFLLSLLFFMLDRDRRRQLAWQKSITSQIDRLAGLHDRLVREVARGRSDMGQMREGLAMTGARLGTEHAALTTASPEARMIETIVAQLSSLGRQSAPGLGTSDAAPVLELEMNPPPRPQPEANPMEYALIAAGGQRSQDMILRLIEQAVRDDAIDLFLQPVVSLPQRKLRMYEAFARLRAADGLHIAASHYLETAQREKLAPAIDNLLLLRCLQMLRRTAEEPTVLPFVLNVSGATLADAGFMGDLLTFLSDNRTMAARLIFELTQDEVEKMPASSGAVIAGLVKLGCVFSMDGVRRRQLDLEMLRQRHIRYIKVDAAWLVREGAERAGAARVLRFKQQLDTAGIDLIVERIETEDALRTILDFNIDFGQGYLFGKPDIASARQFTR